MATQASELTDEHIAKIANAVLEIACAGMADTPKLAIGGLLTALGLNEGLTYEEKVALAQRVYREAQKHQSEWPLYLP